MMDKEDQILQIHPLELKFAFELKKQISCSLQLSNNTENHVAFKVKTTNIQKYCVRPNTGFVLPRSTCDVTVTMQAQKEAPPDMQCMDKFLIQSVIVATESTPREITSKMFSKEAGHIVEESKLKVVYQSLLQIDPLELKFAFELKKQIYCSMRLSNKTENHVAFKVKTTNPKKYAVRPNTGIVLPRSACDVTVIMQAQKEAPPDMQCSDKFMVQSVIVATGITPNEITSEMFSKEAGQNVEECKLKGVYQSPPWIDPLELKVVYQAPPRPPSPVAEGSEEGDDTAMEKRSFNGSKLLRVLKKMMILILPWRKEALMDLRDDPKGLLTPLIDH